MLVTKKTNKLGPGTTQLTVNVPKEFKDEIKALAKLSNTKLSIYVRAILTAARDESAIIESVGHDVDGLTGKKRLRATILRKPPGDKPPESPRSRGRVKSPPLPHFKPGTATN